MDLKHIRKGGKTLSNILEKMLPEKTGDVHGDYLLKEEWKNSVKNANAYGQYGMESMVI